MTHPLTLPDPAQLRSYRRIALITEGCSTPFLAKTAISLLRYRGADVVAVLDSTEAGRTAEDLFGTGGGTPVLSHVREVDRPDAVFIGIAPPGGRLPAPLRALVVEAVAAGVDVVSGLHDFLSDDDELTAMARRTGAKLIDVRRNHERSTATCHAFRPGCVRIHTVGHDCSVGKMVASLEIDRGLRERGRDSCFVATGQTGIMIAGDGVPVDCVVSDFVNGAVEQLVRRHEQHEFVLIEGQGCLTHPAFSAVTAGLLHGGAPQGLVMVYEVGRAEVKGLDGIPLKSLDVLIPLYEQMASQRFPCRVIGIAMNSRNVTREAAARERAKMQERFGLPVCDVYRDGADVLVDAAEQLAAELLSKSQ